MLVTGMPLGLDTPAPQGGIDIPLLVLAALVVLALNAAWYITRWPWASKAQPDRLARKLDAKAGRLLTLESTLGAAKTPPALALTAAASPSRPQNTAGTTPAPVTGKPVTGKPVTGKTVTRKIVTRKTVTRKTVTRKTVTRKTVTRKTVTDDEMTAVPWRAGPADATWRPPVATEPPLGYLLRVRGDPSLPHTLPLPAPPADAGGRQQRPIRIGRHRQNNTVVIGDKYVSREHALIVQKEGRLYLRDNASSAGTYLNWRRLGPGEELLLRHIDILGFGEVLYKLHLGTL